VRGPRVRRSAAPRRESGKTRDGGSVERVCLHMACFLLKRNRGTESTPLDRGAECLIFRHFQPINTSPSVVRLGKLVITNNSKQGWFTERFARVGGSGLRRFTSLLRWCSLICCTATGCEWDSVTHLSSTPTSILIDRREPCLLRKSQWRERLRRSGWGVVCTGLRRTRSNHAGRTGPPRRRSRLGGTVLAIRGRSQGDWASSPAARVRD
jgi:hypothetical protein